MSFVKSVRPSVRIEQLSSQWMNFHEILYVSKFFKNLFEKI